MRRLNEILLFSFLISFVFTFKCGHNMIRNITPISIELSKPKTTNKNLTRLLEEKHPIKFYIDDTTIKSQVDGARITNEYLDEVMNALKTATEMFEQLLKVARTGNIKIEVDISDYGITQVSDNVKTTGVDADIVIFPSFNSSLSNGIEAAAAPIVLENNNKGRPIAGIVYLNTKNYNFAKSNSEEYLEMLFFHELSHVLVFSDALFKNFANIANPYTTSIINGIQRTLLSTPKVIEKAKQYFGCDSLTGVELEDQGGEGTAMGHWESRIMLGDYMIGADYGETVISEISLAVFEDSGWYDVNYYTGGLFRYGKGKGCSFLNQKCASDSYVLSGNEFCKGKAEPFCLSGRTGRGICYISSYTKELNTQYQYYSDPTKGGYEPADYCPVAFAPSDENYYYPTSCSFGKIDEFPSSLAQEIGNSSVCMISSLTPQNGSGLSEYRNKMRSMCYPITCDNTSKTVTIKIGPFTISCPKEGGEKTLDGYTGSIFCPDYNLVCTGTSFCNEPISCIKLKSIPLDGTFTYDYKANNDQNVKSSNIKGNGSNLSISLSMIIILIVELLL